MRLTKTSVSLGCALVVAVAAFGTPAARAAERVHRTEHFALTWSDDPSDPDAPALHDRGDDGVPDTVTRMTIAFEDARAFLVDVLGYREPPTRGRYNLYLSSAIDRGMVRTAPGGNGRSKPSFVTIPIYLMKPSADLGEVRAFAVHEYFHAVQMGYDAAEDEWIREASSSWVQSVFEPGARHNQLYLHDFVPRLELGLESDDGVREYGAFLFLQFLTERFGSSREERPALIRELWEAMAVPDAIEGAPDDDSIAALQRVLGARGVTLADAWREFQLWAWQLNRFESGDEYRRTLRAEKWPNAPAIPVAGETCRLTANAPESVLPSLAGDYVRLTPTTTDAANARIAIRGPAGTTAFAIVRPAQGSPVVREVAFDANGIGTLDLTLGGRAARRVILGLGNGGTVPAAIEYSARVEGFSSVVAHSPVVPATTIYGTALLASGRVECGGAPAAFARVAVTRTEAASGSTETVELTTDAFGQWRLLVLPEATSSFTVQVVDPLLSSAASGSSTVGVRVAVSMSVADDQLEEGEPVTVEGSVAPVHAGEVVLERRRPAGRFEVAATATVDGEGRYGFEHVLPGPGLWEVRVTMPDTGDDDHLPGDSAPKVVHVGET